MPFYNDLRPKSDFKNRDFALVFPGMIKAEKKRAINGLLRLKQGLSLLPDKKSEENILIASWNIKEFGHTKQRLPEAYFYIAEIISSFDLVAIQEIKSTLVDLNIIMRILGSNWDYIFTDVTDGTKGNNERSGYLFNKDRVNLSGLAGEVSLWDKLTKGRKIKQLARTPYMTGFKTGWKSFAMVNLHLHPSKKANDFMVRKEEVELLMAAFKAKAKKRQLWTENIIFVGDFNFYDGDDKDGPTIKHIEDSGYFQIKSLLGKDTNASKTEAYDRIFLSKNNYFKIALNDEGGENAGVFNPFDFVYREGKHNTYKKYIVDHYTGKKDKEDLKNDPVQLHNQYIRYWRRNQISDHFPIWFELTTDSSREFLSSRLKKLQR